MNHLKRNMNYSNHIITALKPCANPVAIYIYMAYYPSKNDLRNLHVSLSAEMDHISAVFTGLSHWSPKFLTVTSLE